MMTLSLLGQTPFNPILLVITTLGSSLKFLIKVICFYLLLSLDFSLVFVVLFFGGGWYGVITFDPYALFWITFNFMIFFKNT